MHATVVHFSGHESPGGLVFEDDLGRAQPVGVQDLMARLRQHALGDGAFPRLFFLAARHGVGTGATRSTAATLHREGFACVLSYSGPVPDLVGTAAEVAFYRSLSTGEPLFYAIQQARAAISREYTQDGQRLRQPLGWSRLVVYLRGDNSPLTTSQRRAGPRLASPRLQREEIVVSGLPVLEHGFIGRRGLLHEIRRKLRDGQRLFVLHGLGGLGKTALASHILRKLVAGDTADQLILRVQHATDVSALRAQAEAHGDALKLPDWSSRVKELHEQHPEPGEGFHETVSALRRHRPDLVVYADNMEALQIGPADPTGDPRSELGAWRPGVDHWWHQMESLARSGVVLASTRYMWKGIPRESFIPLDPMNRADLWRMVDTLPTLSRLPPHVRERIAETADGRPRTLLLLEGLVRQADDDPTRTIADAWTDWVEPVLAHHGARLTEDLLLDQLWRHLSAIARSHAAAIAILQQPAPRAVIDALGAAAPELIRSGLLTRHREIFDNLDVDGPPVQRDRWFMLAVVRDFSRLNGPPIHPGQSARAAADAYHALLSALVHADIVETIRLYHEAGDADTAWPLVRTNALWLRNRGSYLEALHSLARSKELGLNDLNRAEYNGLLVQFNVLTGLNPGDLDVATLTEALADSPDEIKILKLHAAAILLDHQGRYAEAEAMLRNKLAIIEDSFGGVHSSHNSTMNNLANVLMQQGRYAEASNILTRQLEIIHSAPEGTGSPSDQSIVLHNIAKAFEVQGFYGAAERALDISLKLKEALFGREHPSYGHSLYSRGVILMRQGRIEASVGVLRDAVEILRNNLGESHHGYGAALSGLAQALDEQGEQHEAEKLMRLAMNIQVESRGKNHPESLTAVQSFAVMLAEHDKLDEAEPLLRATLAIQDEMLGKEHPNAGIARINLASVLAMRGKHVDVEPLLRAANTILKTALGHNHPDYASFLHNAAGITADDGDLDTAIQLLSTALAIRERVLGPDHPLYSASLCSLAQTLTKRGRMNDAERLLEGFLIAQESLHGKDHTSLYWPLCHLATVCASAGQYLKARRLLDRSRQLATLNLDPRHKNLQKIQQLQQEVDGVLATGRHWRTWTGRKRRSPPRKT